MTSALLLAAILASPASAAPASCDEFCATVKKIVAARGDAFASLRGKRSLGMIRMGTAVPPGAHSCLVYPLQLKNGKLDDMQIHRTHYRCLLPAASQEAAQTLYADSLKRVKAAVPKAWTWSETASGERYAVARAGQEIVVILRRGDTRDFRGFLEVFAALPYDKDVEAGRRHLDNVIVRSETSAAAELSLDGKPLGRMPAGEDFWFHAPAGAHALKAVLANGQSFEYALSMKGFDRTLYLGATKLGDHDEEEDDDY